MPNGGQRTLAFLYGGLDEFFHVAAAIFAGRKDNFASCFYGCGAMNLDDAFEPHTGTVSLLLHFRPAKDFLHQLGHMDPNSLRPQYGALPVHSQVRFVVFRHMRHVRRILPRSSLEARVAAYADAVLENLNHTAANPDLYFLPCKAVGRAVILFCTSTW